MATRAQAGSDFRGYRHTEGGVAPRANAPGYPRTGAAGRERPDPDIMWPLVYWPMIWVGIIHVGTRVMWLLGFG